MPIPIAAVLGILVGQALGIEASHSAINYNVWKLLPFKKFGAADGIDLRHKKLIDKTRYVKLMAMEGYNKEKCDIFYEASYTLLELGDLIRLKWRGEIDATEFSNRAAKIRVRPAESRLIEKASLYFPSPMELIRMAVREVFTPDIVETFQLDADLPAEFLELGKKVGLTEETAKWTWRAHWILPSLTMGFEMLHRRIISKDELKLLLRTQDVMPFWRDKLIELSYRPLTRVDVRRMFDFGVLDRKGVYESYLDGGYSPKNAELMTQFTEKYVIGEERLLTKTQIKKAYKIGEFNTEETITWLAILGYPEPTAAFVVALWEHEIWEKYLDVRIEVLSLQTVDGFITVDQFRDQIGELNLPASRLEKILVDIQHDLLKHLKLPSKDDLVKFLKANTIQEPIFREYMAKLGYRSLEIDMYVKNVMGSIKE